MEQESIYDCLLFTSENNAAFVPSQMSKSEN